MCSVSVKISKTETKILTHASGFIEKQSLEKSDDEERNQPTTESNFRESWQKKRPTKRERNKKVTEKHIFTSFLHFKKM